MKIEQLIKELQKYPQDMIVLVQGYEGGFADIGTIKNSKVTLGVHHEEWNGPHEENEDSKTPALIILRNENK